jgi:hypothetical protein
MPLKMDVAAKINVATAVASIEDGGLKGPPKKSLNL